MNELGVIGLSVFRFECMIKSLHEPLLNSSSLNVNSVLSGNSRLLEAFLVAAILAVPCRVVQARCIWTIFLVRSISDHFSPQSSLHLKPSSSSMCMYMPFSCV